MGLRGMVFLAMSIDKKQMIAINIDVNQAMLIWPC